MSAATGDFDFLDFSLAMWAGLIFSTENLRKKFEIVTSSAVGFDIGFHGGAAGGDRLIHYIASGLQEEFGLWFRDGAGFTLGVDLSGKESLVGIDIP